MKQSVELFHIGTQKAASTYLYNLLKNHPEVSLNKLTEVNYFTSRFGQDKDWYETGFVGSGQKIDTSPKYFMQGEMVLPRLRTYLDKNKIKPKFLLILRNPIDYLYSHFQMHLRHRFFQKNLDMYPELSESLLEHIKMYPQYLNRARYAEILQKQWLNHFDLDQFKIISFEKFVRQNSAAMAEILEFWQLAPMELKTDTASKNKMLRFRFLLKWQDRVIRNEKLKEKLKRSALFNKVYDKVLTVKSNDKLSDDERQKIKNIFKDDVNELRQLTGQEFREWKDFF